MNKQTFAQQFNQQIDSWLDYDSVPQQIVIDQHTFVIDYDSGQDQGPYRVLLDGQLIAWNDRERDFRQVGSFVYDTVMEAAE